MKIKKLIKILEKYDPELTVVLSSDGEGNGFSPLSDETKEKYLPENKWSGELIHPDDYDSEVHKDSIDVLVLWPTN
jgi:hypothetical protein